MDLLSSFLGDMYAMSQAVWQIITNFGDYIYNQAVEFRDAIWTFFFSDVA